MAGQTGNGRYNSCRSGLRLRKSPGRDEEPVGALRTGFLRQPATSEVFPNISCLNYELSGCACAAARVTTVPLPIFFAATATVRSPGCTPIAARRSRRTSTGPRRLSVCAIHGSKGTSRRNHRKWAIPLSPRKRPLSTFRVRRVLQVFGSLSHKSLSALQQISHTRTPSLRTFINIGLSRPR